MYRKAYKLLRMKNGILYPLYVYADEPVQVGVWLSAKDGPMTKTGHVKSRLGELAFRPGWHLSDIPLATHIGVKDVHGNIIAMHPDTVWCECLYHADVDYSKEAEANGWRNGRYDPRRAMLKKIPVNGWYRYKTNPKMYGTWIIAGEMKILRILSDEEVAVICHEAGVEPMPRAV